MKKLLLILLVLITSTAFGQLPKKQLLSDTTKVKKVEQTAPKKKEMYVTICNSKRSYAYHKHECKGLKRCKAGTTKLTLTDAKNKGYKPCGFCYK